MHHFFTSGMQRNLSTGVPQLAWDTRASSLTCWWLKLDKAVDSETRVSALESHLSSR